LDNRRLSAFKAAQVDNIPIQRVDLSDPVIDKNLEIGLNQLMEEQKLLLFQNLVELTQGECFVNSENKERIDIADLSLEWLEKYPVWTWYIGSLFEPEDEIIPVDLNSESIDEIDVLFARAEFTTVDGLSLKGWISYDIDADNVYNIDFFMKIMISASTQI